MSVQRSSFPQKLLSTSSNLLKKELHSSHFKGVFQKLWNKANKKAVSAFRTFLKNVYDEINFWKNYRLLLPTLTQINSIVAISRKFSKRFETIKNVSSWWNVPMESFQKSRRRLLCFVFKKEKILLLLFQKQPPYVFHEKWCP